MRYSTTIAPDSAGRIKATVTFEGEKVRVNLGITVQPSEWNVKKNEIKANVVIGGKPAQSLNGLFNEVRIAVDEAMATNPNKESVTKEAQLAVPITGDSMYPEFPNGSIVLVKKIDESLFIEWGKAYVLDTCNGAVCKILTPSEKEDYLRCESVNEKYAPFEI